MVPLWTYLHYLHCFNKHRGRGGGCLGLLFLFFLLFTFGNSACAHTHEVNIFCATHLAFPISLIEQLPSQRRQADLFMRPLQSGPALSVSQVRQTMSGSQFWSPLKGRKNCLLNATFDCDWGHRLAWLGPACSIYVSLFLHSSFAIVAFV